MLRIYIISTRSSETLAAWQGVGGNIATCLAEVGATSSSVLFPNM